MKTTRRDFIIQGGTAAVALGFLPFLSNASSKKEIFAGKKSGKFSRVTPESQGIPSAAITKFLNRANESGMEWHSFMLLRNGHIVAEGCWKPFDLSYKHTLYSLSKSFTSTAIGLLVTDKKINVEDQLITFFPDLLPAEISENLKQMKIKHLLSMNTGHDTDTTPTLQKSNEPWTKKFLSLPVEHEPGTHFLYNSGATYMLGAIVKKVTGQDLETFLTSRLFQPLEIEDHDWEKSPEGLNVAGWGLRLKTEDIAKLGQLYLQKGKWNGKQILSEEWVNAAGSSQTKSNSGDGDWSQGYGYQFWRCKPGFFRGDGAFGQYCIVMPQHDVVLVVTSESWDMQKQMTVMWETLLPSLSATALKPNDKDLKQLHKDINQLSIPTPENSLKISPAVKDGAVYAFKSNDFGLSTLGFKFSDDNCTLMFTNKNGSQSIVCGWQKWVTNKESQPYFFIVPNRNPTPSKIAGTAMWTDKNTLQVNFKFLEGIHGDKVKCMFNGNEISITLLNSVSENNKNITDNRMTLTGTVA
jgi:CubicO group peptidase (beta-lactamase class C family)